MYQIIFIFNNIFFVLFESCGMAQAFAVIMVSRGGWNGAGNVGIVVRDCRDGLIGLKVQIVCYNVLSGKLTTSKVQNVHF